MNHTVIASLADRISTPGYVFDTDVFARRVRLVKDAFGPNAKLCFSIKANPFLLSYLPEEFDKIEVCSPGELTICEKIGVDMKKVIFSGVNKTREDVIRAVEDGVGVFTAESYLHLQFIQECAAERGIVVPVLVRLTAGSQFGMAREDVLHVIDNRSSYPNIEIVGIHFFSGTQKKKASVIEKELDKLVAFVEEVAAEHQFALQRLEYGTGLAVDYFTAEAEELELSRLEAISDKVREVAQKIDLTIEMGRFFAASCGYYFTKVMDVKTNDGVNYAIVDGGLNQLKYDGQIQGMQIPMIQHVRKTPVADAAEQPWTLCGSLCTTADVLARNATFCGLTRGDILVFERTGAYSVMEGMALFLSREFPEVNVFSEEGGLVQLRKITDASRFNISTVSSFAGGC